MAPYWAALSNSTGYSSPNTPSPMLVVEVHLVYLSNAVYYGVCAHSYIEKGAFFSSSTALYGSLILSSAYETGALTVLQLLVEESSVFVNWVRFRISNLQHSRCGLLSLTHTLSLSHTHTHTRTHAHTHTHKHTHKHTHTHSHTLTHLHAILLHLCPAVSPHIQVCSLAEAAISSDH